MICNYQLDLEDPDSATNDRIAFHFCSDLNLCLLFFDISPK